MTGFETADLWCRKRPLYQLSHNQCTLRCCYTQLLLCICFKTIHFQQQQLTTPSSEDLTQMDDKTGLQTGFIPKTFKLWIKVYYS